MTSDAGTDRRAHWEKVYCEKSPLSVSWYQASPEPSLSLIEAGGHPPTARLIDVGGGASTLVDHLLARGHRDVTVLDLASAALGHARRRLGERAGAVRWLTGDVTDADLGGPFEVWHDRAVFHFLTDARLRSAYRAQLLDNTGAGACVIVATFALDGPERCSGLPVARYSPESLATELGPAFRLEEARAVSHTTPGGSVQHFQFSRFRRRAG